jgi:hypothetical protein
LQSLRFALQTCCWGVESINPNTINTCSVSRVAMTQLNAFLRKSIIVKRNYKCCLFVEIFLPLFFVGLSAFLKSQYAFLPKSHRHSYSSLTDAPPPQPTNQPTNQPTDSLQPSDSFRTRSSLHRSTPQSAVTSPPPLLPLLQCTANPLLTTHTQAKSCLTYRHKKARLNSTSKMSRDHALHCCSLFLLTPTVAFSPILWPRPLTSDVRDNSEIPSSPKRLWLRNACTSDCRCI